MSLDTKNMQMDLVEVEQSSIYLWYVFLGKFSEKNGLGLRV